MATIRKYEYEDAFGFVLEKLGFKVVGRKDYLKCASYFTDQTVIVREFIPRAWDDQILRDWQLDFSCPPALAYLEIDGFGGGRTGGHRNWTGFHRDREKDRNLTLRRWRGLRFGPGDLHSEEGMFVAAKQFASLIALACSEHAPILPGHAAQLKLSPGVRKALELVGDLGEN